MLQFSKVVELVTIYLYRCQPCTSTLVAAFRQDMCAGGGSDSNDSAVLSAGIWASAFGIEFGH